MKPFTTICAGLLLIVSCVHLLRYFFKWEIIINGWIFPQWVSILSFLITSFLAYMLIREAKQ